MSENFFDRKWYEKLWNRIYGFFYRMPMNIRWGFKRFKAFFVRGRRGWAHIDTWSLDHYLARVIRDSIQDLKDTMPGVPSMVDTEEEWNKILDHIIWTFDMAIKIGDDEVFMFEEEYFESKERYLEVKERIQKNICDKYGKRIATDEEIEKYKEGWKLFEKYFFCLWS